MTAHSHNSGARPDPSATASYNLVRQPFVPVLDRGGRRLEMGLLDTLTRAHDLRGVHDDSPLITVSMLRLLLAVVMRVEPVSDARSWRRLWDSGRFNAERLEEYFRRWSARFELFDSDRPFYQDPAVKGPKGSPISRMVHQESSGDNRTLFSHAFDSRPAIITPGEAARRLVGLQAFGFSGTAGTNPVPFQFMDTPNVRTMHLLALGRSLFETLLLNSGPPRVLEGETQTEADAPAWERQDWPPPSSGGTHPLGLLDRLTWQSRSPFLLSVESAGGGTRINGVVVRQRYRLHDDALHDPQVPQVKSLESGSRGRRFVEDRAVWRDSASLLAFAEGSRATRGLTWLASICEQGCFPLVEFRLLAAGLCTVPGKASITHWRSESLPVRASYLGDPEMVADLARSLDTAEQIARVLGSAVETMVRWVLEPAHTTGTKPKRNMRLRIEGAKRAALSDYWSSREPEFLVMLASLSEDADDRTAAVDAWIERCAETARHVVRKAGRELVTQARGMRAAVEAERQLTRGLGPLIPARSPHHA